MNKERENRFYLGMVAMILLTVIVLRMLQIGYWVFCI